jgi:hypothetical protein
VRLTVPHYHQFGSYRGLVGDDLLNPSSWDRLRMETETMFGFDADVWDWEQRISADAYQRRRAHALVAWLDALGVEEVTSYGVGSAPVERWIHRLRPGWRLRLTDYAPRTVARLRQHFPEAETHHHDLREHPPLAGDVHLLCCVDTEFSDEEWLMIYDRFADAVVVIYPCATLGLSTVVNELRQRTAGNKPTRCGYWRTRSKIEELVGHTHQPRRLSSGGRLGTAWICRPRS